LPIWRGILDPHSPPRRHRSGPSAVSSWRSTMSLFGEPFTAKCLKSGITIEGGEGQSLLQPLLDNGISMDYSCEGGVCGTRVVPLGSGEVERMDEFLTADGLDSQIITCVSRGDGEIQIDV